jgi:hypothetical protein
MRHVCVGYIGPIAILDKIFDTSVEKENGGIEKDVKAVY